MDLIAVGRIDESRAAALAAFVAPHTTTERVIRDLGPAGLQLDAIVAMDEYTLDLVVALPGDLWLVYDTT